MPGTEQDQARELQQSALQTSVAVLQRQRRAEQQLLQTQRELEAVSARQADSLSLLNATLNASRDAIAAITSTGQLVVFNTNFTAMWGLTDAMILLEPKTIRQNCANLLATPDDPWAWEAKPDATLRDEVLLRDGRILERYISVQITIGEQACRVLQWHDITERRRAEMQRNRMTLILERSLNEVYLFELETLRFTYANTGALANLGYSLDELMRMTPVDIKPEYDEPAFRRMIEPLLNRSTELLIFETVHQRVNGSHYNVQVHLQIDREGEYPLFMALILDITERKQADQVIWNQANFDSLTGLPNRTMLQDRLGQEMSKAARRGHKLALMFIDLDKFKEVNDTLGHDRGDVLLVNAARRIRDCVRASDTVSRLGGDEFVVLLTELTDARMASNVAHDILQVLAEPFDLGGVQAVVSGSIGITLYPDDATDHENLFKNADQAMYVSKARGRNQCSYFTRELEMAAQRRMLLVDRLRAALAAGQFFVHFQPIVDLRTRRFNKAEALIRWHHPELGTVSPAEFIPLAEETGLIVSIGDWVLEEAARYTKRWRTLFSPDFQVSVNKSAVQFNREKGNPGLWPERLKRFDLPGNAVTLEITESVLVDPNSDVRETLLAYRDAGIQVAIDDFGTGYSSLSYLKRFDIDYLKIDQSFTTNLAPGSADLVLSQAIIAMAHALGLRVVAEGVETPEQLSLLVQAGCDFAQGYLLSRPLAPEALEALLYSQKFDGIFNNIQGIA